jgi:hypothetical protein
MLWFLKAMISNLEIVHIDLLWPIGLPLLDHGILVGSAGQQTG